MRTSFIISIGKDSTEARPDAAYNRPLRAWGGTFATGFATGSKGRILATKQQVEGKLRELIKRLAQSGQEVRGSLADTLPQSRIVEVTLSDLGASYWTELSGGQMGTLRKGRPDRADIRVTVESDHLVDLIDGKKSLFSSYLSGRVKIEASLADLVRLRKLA